MVGGLCSGGGDSVVVGGLCSDGVVMGRDSVVVGGTL